VTNYLDTNIPFRPDGIPLDLPTDPPQYKLDTVAVNGDLKLYVEETTGVAWVSVGDAQPVAVVRGGDRALQQLDANTKLTGIGRDANGNIWLLGTAPDGNLHYPFEINAKFQIQGNGAALYNADYQTLEPWFHQDFNGDGIILAGTPNVVSQNGALKLLVDSGNGLTYVQNGNAPLIEVKASGDALALKRAGDSFVGVGNDADGNLVLLDKGGDGTLSGWTFDAKGNLTNVTTYTPATIANAEAIFQQDLNGDGQVPAPLDQVVAKNGKLELLVDPTTGIAVIQLEDGSRVTVTRDGWGDGVQLNHGSQLFAIGRDDQGRLRVLDGNPNDKSVGSTHWAWVLDDSGRYVDQTVFSGDQLGDAELIFGQDLNGDGMVEGSGPKLTQVATGGGNTLYVDPATGIAYVSVAGADPVKVTRDGDGWGDVQLQHGDFGLSAITTDDKGRVRVLDTSANSDLRYAWILDANGKWAGENSFDAATAGQAETLFGKDLDGNGVVGNNMKLIDQDGDNMLFEDTTTGVAYVEVHGQDPIMVTRDGADWGDVQLQRGDWSLAAITVDDQGRTRVLDENPFSDMKYAWILDANGHWYGEQSFDGSTVGQAETLFGKDLNADGTIGTRAAGTISQNSLVG